jgi:hypothetical protein
MWRTRRDIALHQRGPALAQLLLALLLAASTAAVLAPGATATPARGFLYKVEFEGEGVQNIKDADGNGNTIEQHATWTIKPEPAEIWLPQVTEPRGPGNELKTTAGSGLVAQDYSNVHQSLGCGYNAPGSGCTLEFRITGSYDLTLLCGGTVENGSSGTSGCGGSGTGSSEPKKEAEKAPAGGSEKQSEKVAQKSQSATSGTLALSDATAKGDTVQAKVACTGGTNATCAGSLTLTAVRTVHKKLHGHPHSVKESVTVASTDVLLTAPNTQTLKLKLNGMGSALLAKSRKLAVTLDLTSTSGTHKTIATKKLALSYVASGPARNKRR